MEAEMTTTVTLTGTGVPHPAPGRAGAGVLVRHGEVSLQFDAGRGTVMRMTEAGVAPAHLTAQLVTHYHSDHVVDLADVAMTRWIMNQLVASGPLPVITPNGPARAFVERMLEPFDDDIHVRREHTGSEQPSVEIMAFDAPVAPTEVWRSADGVVRVSAIAVRHEPVLDAVAYRVDTPDGAVVISGDTRACPEVFELARGADVVVHEACRTAAMAKAISGTVFETIFSYHSDTIEVGRLARDAGVPRLVLTHLIPAPKDEHDERRFADDVRDGGFTGDVVVGRDLMVFEIGGS
jgi:ribonuclease Z